MSNHDGSVTITLSSPIPNGSESINEVTVRKMVAGDLRAMKSNNSAGSALDLAAKLCGLPPSVMDKMDMKDFGEVMEIVSRFLPNSLAIGKQQSEG